MDKIIPLRIAIISPDKLPVPATQGGAIESTIQLIIKQNEIYQYLTITVVSAFQKQAYKNSREYKHTSFVWLKKKGIYTILDLIFRATRKILKTNDTLECEIIKCLIRKNDYDKIIIHGNQSHLRAVAKVVNKEKIVFYVHANYFSVKTQSNVEVSQLPGIIIAVSEFIKQKIIVNTGTNEKRVYVIKNPIDIVSITKTDSEVVNYMKVNYKIESNQFVILFIGRIVENKGIRELIYALISLKNQLSFKLFVIGSFGSDFGSNDQKDVFSDEIRQIAKEINDRIVFTGFIQNTLISNYLSLCDIVVMPSKVEEAAGKVAMEAMAAGKPVITTTQGGIPEYVKDGAGILLDINDSFVNNLSKAILKLANNRELCEQMGAKGKEIAREFHPERFYKDYVDIIHKNPSILP